MPRSSPDYTPIELALAKLKTAPRRAQARSYDAVVHATGATFRTITAADARSCFTAARYTLPGPHL